MTVQYIYIYIYIYIYTRAVISVALSWCPTRGVSTLIKHCVHQLVSWSPG
eukprot:COSAG03_NODE_14229_length_472_cov_0.621984_1_plen_49_part_01